MVPALVARNLDLWCVLIVLVGSATPRSAASRVSHGDVDARRGHDRPALLSSVLASFNRFVFADWVIFPVYAASPGTATEVAALPDPGRVAVVGIWTMYLMIGRFSVNRFVG